jgi:hypothetical protein
VDRNRLGANPFARASARPIAMTASHAIKQVDRMLSNQGIDVWDSFARWWRSASVYSSADN